MIEAYSSKLLVAGSIPVSRSTSDHFGALRLLFIGLMIAGPRFSEARVLALAYAYERATEWHTRKPPLTPDTPLLRSPSPTKMRY